jgi:DNA-binding GntR family transcriptional regulator
VTEDTAAVDGTLVDAGQSARRESNEPDLATQAYERIRQAIRDLTFEPGQPLQEVALARWLGISRTPVREAMRRLQSEGLVEIAPSRGAVVAQVSIEDVANAYAVLAVLEALAGRLAAERLTEAGAARLHGVLAELRAAAEAVDLDRWTRLDAELHDTIRAVAGNPKLEQATARLYPVIERVRSVYLREGHEPEQLAVANAEHCAVAEAILAGDAEGAERLTRQLFAKAGADNVRLLTRWVWPLRRSF